MRISEIKQLTDSKKIKTIICKEFWDNPVFREPLSAYKKESCDIHNVFAIIVNTFIQFADDNPTDISLNDYKKSIKTISRILYGNSYYWAEGTRFEDDLHRENERQERIKQRLLNQERLKPLYSQLHLNPKHKPDILKLVSYRTEIVDSICLVDFRDITRENLYQICYKVLVSIILDNKGKYNDFAILRCTSYFATGDEYDWADKAGYPREMIPFYHNNSEGLEQGRNDIEEQLGGNRETI